MPCRLNEELIARTGSRIDQATVEQLRKGIQLLERWKERGYDGTVKRILGSRLLFQQRNWLQPYSPHCLVLVTVASISC